MISHTYKEPKETEHYKNIPIQYTILENGCWKCTSHLSNDPNYRVQIKRNKIRKLLHVYIYEWEIEKIKKGKVVRHKCDNSWCINVEHMKLGSQKDNMNDKVIRNRQLKGESMPTSKLTDTKVLEILSDTRSYRKIAKDYNVTYFAIWRIKSGDGWKHLKDEVVVEDVKLNSSP